MSRIEEMKNRLHQLLPTTPYEITDHKEESFKWASNYQSDVQYLLSRLEIAEKALEKIAYQTLDDGSHAMTALQQLRE